MRDVLLNAIRSTRGKFFGVTFTKADGSKRLMNCSQIFQWWYTKIQPLR